MSSFNGKTFEIPWLSIDEFTEDNLSSTCYLLSHCHVDHMKGIGESNFISRLNDNPDIFLYCSDITATILHYKYQGLARIRHKIIALPIHGATIVNIPTPGSSIAGIEVSVTTIPAGHCPGSVMFLLEGLFGTVLYTGDFRLALGDARKLKALQDSSGRVRPITSLYLDTTFLSLRESDVTSFPSRLESAAELCRLVRDALGLGKEVNLVTSARYGSEFLFLRLHKQFNMKVHVCRSLYDVYRHIPDIQHAVTVDCDSTRIHSYSAKSRTSSILSTSSDPTCRIKNKREDVRNIKPSVLWWNWLKTRDKPLSKRNSRLDSKDRWSVIYSCHSSHEEILDFVSYVKPERIEPCVVPPHATRRQVLEVCNKLVEPWRRPQDNTAPPPTKLARLSQSVEDSSSDESLTSSPTRPTFPT